MTRAEREAEQAWWSRWAAGNAQFALHLARREKERAARGAQEPATSNAGSRPSRVLKGS